MLWPQFPKFYLNNHDALFIYQRKLIQTIDFFTNAIFTFFNLTRSLEVNQVQEVATDEVKILIEINVNVAAEVMVKIVIQVVEKM